MAADVPGKPATGFNPAGEPAGRDASNLPTLLTIPTKNELDELADKLAWETETN